MRVFAGIFVALAAILPSATLGSRAASASSPDVPEEEKTVPIVLYPAAEPQPALKYQLLPPFLERRPGNAAVWWNRIPAERNVFFDKLYADNGPWRKIERWMEIPIGDPREKEQRREVLANDVGVFGQGGIFADIERAARFESCDWEQPIREGNYIAILLPEIQESRSYARILSARAHLEIAEGRYDDAVRTMQCGYAEGRQVAQSPFMVSELVGVTIAGIMSYQVEQFIQQPDAPNLYWALSTLPRPIVDSRLCGEAESNLLYLQFPELRDLDKKQLAPAEWRGLLIKVTKLVVEYDAFFNPGGLKKHVAPAMTTLAALQSYPLAKRYLVEHGRNAAEVEAMPVAQVILLYTVRVYDELRDEQFKWFFVPAAEGRHGLRRAEADLGRKAHAKEIVPIASSLLPAAAAVKEAEARNEWNVAVMRVFEAMRLYAAAHDGRWPERLGDITEVPIPVNPVDGKPFVYERQGGKAILTCEKGTRNWHKRFEITLMPKRK